MGVLAFCLFLGCAAAAVPPHILRGQRLVAPHLPEGTPLPPAEWVEQKLDHLTNDHGDTTWKQRYFVNSTWWDKESGPVFILLGGEGPANPSWIVADTNIMRNAQKYKALVFSVEHRYVQVWVGRVKKAYGCVYWVCISQARATPSLSGEGLVQGLVRYNSRVCSAPKIVGC
jgi:hypothetical protein